MRVDRLVSMANDIGSFFDSEPDKTLAARNVATHLRRYWDPRMRRQILAHYREGGAGLNPVVRSGLAVLAEETVTAT